MNTHTESAFETHVATWLVDHGGYVLRQDSDYDRVRALIPADVIGFIEATQPKAWQKVQAIHKDKTAELFLSELCKVMAKEGSLSVLRHGLKFYGQPFKLAQFAPAHGLNPQVQSAYDANCVAVARQVHYDPANQNSLDLVLFLNGIPIVTAELKNQMTGQRACEHAVKQYRENRSPTAPIFRFKQRALVHFAVDPDEAWMTTRLAEDATKFLPFNQGYGTASGNPPTDDKHRTAYLWEDVWQRDSLLDLVAAYLHVQVEEKLDKKTGQKIRKEKMIFPRFHQRDAVRKLVAAARHDGVGHNYLVQHSAGSGKSNTIAWLAHRLANLHDAQDLPVFHSVIVITDRRVLDRQLQDTIYQFEHKRGVVEKIDKHSQQLADALVSGVPIIVSTLHKFAFIQDKIASLPDRRYAVIVDEAHSSQTGEMAVALKEVLADGVVSAALEEMTAENPDLSPVDLAALRSSLLRNQQSNLSYFAFTATPKFKTLSLFGYTTPDGRPAPFHLYSMRQAIEEGFILDVLKGYTTYSRYFQLVKAVSEDPELDKRKAARALARFVNLHPTNIAQKSEIILEHFRACVRNQLSGQAKAMVVTDSRLMAIRYKVAFEKYLAEKAYSDVHCLVAFSGEVKDPDLPGVTYTEVGMNKGIKETELPEQFESEAYNVLLVAEKYQTGFDQPLLCAMYVDKRLSGIQAVQTLSRLNRTAPGKDSTFVLDFVNEPDEIRKAFQDFYEVASIAEVVDPQRLYELETKLNDTGIYLKAEVDRFAKAFFQLGADQKLTGHAQLNAALDPAVDRFKDRPEDEREDLRGTLGAFKNLYAFLAQVVPFQDADLEKLYAYGRMLLTKLPRLDQGGPLDLDDDVALKLLVIKKESEGGLELEPGKGEPLAGPTETGTGAGKGPTVKLSAIIEIINQRFGTTFDAQDLVDGVTEQLVADDRIRLAAQANDKTNFAYVFGPALNGALLDRHGKHAEFIDKVFGDEAIGSVFRTLMLEAVYGRLATGETGDHGGRTGPA